MIWLAYFVKNTYIILAYSTSEIVKYVIDFINFFSKKRFLLYTLAIKESIVFHYK